MQTIIRTGTAQEQIEAAQTNLDRIGGDFRDIGLRDRYEFYFQARVELANAMNLQRIANSLDEAINLLKSQPAIVNQCSCGAGQSADAPDHSEGCPCWAPF